MRYLLIVLSAALLCGCNHINGIFGASEEVDYYTDRAQYNNQESVMLTLANRTDAKALNYNLCHSILQEQRAGIWQTSEHEADRVCAAVVYTLEAGKQASFMFQFQQPLPAGVYRFKTSVGLQNKNVQIDLFSNEFQVK